MQALPGTVVSFRLTWPPESYPVSKKQNHVYSVPICNPPVNPFVSSKGIFQSTISRRHCFCVSAEALDLQGSPEAAQDVSLLPVLPLELSSQLLTIRRTSDPASGPHTSAEPALACSALLPPRSPQQPFSRSSPAKRAPASGPGSVSRTLFSLALTTCSASLQGFPTLCPALPMALFCPSLLIGSVFLSINVISTRRSAPKRPFLRTPRLWRVPLLSECLQKPLPVFSVA